MDSNTNSTLHEVTVLIVILLYIYTSEVKTNIVLSNNNMWFCLLYTSDAADES